MSSLLYWSLPDLNWVGFYLVDAASGDLLRRPVPGQAGLRAHPARQGRLRHGGRAARARCVVPDVHAFPGPHRLRLGLELGGRGADRSRDGRLLGVLDLDSPAANRFDDEDARGLEALVAVFVAVSAS